VLDLEVRDRRLILRAPVDHVLATIDQALLVQLDELAPHRSGHAGIERKAQARPIDGQPQAPHLLEDPVAVLFLPLPGPAHEGFAAHRLAIEPLGRQRPLHDVLGSNPGVVGTWQPQNVEACHALVPRHQVLQRLVQAVAEMQHTRHVRRRDDHRERRRLRLVVGAADLLFLPDDRPTRLDRAVFEALGHGLGRRCRFPVVHEISGAVFAWLAVADRPRSL